MDPGVAKGYELQKQMDEMIAAEKKAEQEKKAPYKVNNIKCFS